MTKQNKSIKEAKVPIQFSSVNFQVSGITINRCKNTLFCTFSECLLLLLFVQTLYFLIETTSQFFNPKMFFFLQFLVPIISVFQSKNTTTPHLSGVRFRIVDRNMYPVKSPTRNTFAYSILLFVTVSNLQVLQ